MDNGMELDLLHSRTPYSDATRCRKKKSSNSVKRPMNAFMCFSQWERLKIIRVDPERHNAEISKELGRRWRELSASEKRPFYERSKHLNELHKIEFPDYKYRPRKKRDHSLKLSTAPDGLAVINVSESSSEDNNNNNNNNSSSSGGNNIHNNNNSNSNNGVDKNSKKSLKKLNCRGRTRMFSSSMLVQRTLESTKSSELMENAVLTSSHAAALYNGGDFAAHKTSEHLTDYAEDHPHLEIHNSGVMGIGITSPTAGDECLMRSRSAEQLQQDSYFRSIESNHWMNYDTNNHFSNNYFPLYRSYQEDHHNHHQQQQQHQQHFYNNSLRENFMDDPSYPVRAEYLVSSNMINQQQQQLIYTSWAQDVQSYAGDENLGGKNPTTFNNNSNNSNNNSFYHPTTAVNNEALYADVSHPIKSGFYSHSEPLPIEMWHDYPISQTTDYHRSYSVSSASSTSRSPTSTHPPHPAEEALYLTIDQSAKTQTSDFELKNSSLTSSSSSSGTNQLNSRHPALYNPIFAFAAHDLSLNYLES